MTPLPYKTQDCVEDTFLPKKLKSDDYFSTDEEPQNLILLRMIAKDGFLFNVFTTSTYLRIFIAEVIA